jgi:hypothetical protein
MRDGDGYWIGGIAAQVQFPCVKGKYYEAVAAWSAGERMPKRLLSCAYLLGVCPR